MNIFISGIGGVGMGPLAEIALDAGYNVRGSDLHHSPMTDELEKRGAQIIYEQSTDSIASANKAAPIDWFLYTSALPANAPELIYTKEHQIKATKRDEFLSHFIEEHHLKLIAIAGTHGKTTTTSMLIWVLSQLHVPISYSTGTTLSFADSGKYDSKSELFIYETDEYDRNFLKFYPYIAAIPALDYDHADIYPTQQDYNDAFRQFFNQSQHVMLWQETASKLGVHNDDKFTVYNNAITREDINVAGDKIRHNAYLVLQIVKRLLPDTDGTRIKQLLASFPGASRRFEKLADNLYTDYAHHPTEIAATIEKALEISPNVAVVYQPHQNIRQHQIANEYHHAFDGVKHLYWLPTYLTREDPDLAVLTPHDLISKLANPGVAESVELDDKLWHQIERYRKAGDLVLILGAGPIDSWAREQLASLGTHSACKVSQQ